MILGAITPAARLAAAMRGEVSEILCCPESALSPAARAAAYRLLRTAQNLEWWTRLSTQPPPARPLDLGASTAALLAAVREVCATPPGLLQLAPCRQPLPVAADEAAFEAVLLNLVCNSLLYGGPAPALTLRAARQGSRAVLLLRDGGPGIPPHRQRAALQPFESFSHLPSAGLGLPLAARMALRQKQEKPCGLADFVKICLSWGIGYAGMWSGKWLMAALLTGQNVFAEAGSAMGNRLGAVDDSGVELTLTTGVQENLRIMFNPLTVLMLLGVLAVCALLWLRVGGRPDVKRLGPYLLCALLPIAWYMALLNHSAEHAFFTYRALCVTIFAAVSMAIPTGKAET